MSAVKSALVAVVLLATAQAGAAVLPRDTWKPMLSACGKTTELLDTQFMRSV